VVEVVVGRGGTLTVGDIAHLFGTTESDAEWERLVPTWCDPPLTFAELDELVWPAVRPVVADLPLLPGVGELLSAAKAAGWRVGLATGHNRGRLEARLAALDLSDALDAIVTSADVARGKPAPDIFLEVARRLGAAAADCVVLEDSPPGCEAALAAGMGVVACPSVVTRGLAFPAGVRRVESLVEVTLEDLVASGVGEC
jgi:beta-phosphoglucomutase-like phosphatase (HAD superfamily)